MNHFLCSASSYTFFPATHRDNTQNNHQNQRTQSCQMLKEEGRGKISRKPMCTISYPYLYSVRIVATFIFIYKIQNEGCSQVNAAWPNPWPFIGSIFIALCTRRQLPLTSASSPNATVASFSFRSSRNSCLLSVQWKGFNSFLGHWILLPEL